eukprot:SAG31_NODE_541_length_14275_cov_6.690886_7_plen_70_part_00
MRGSDERLDLLLDRLVKLLRLALVDVDEAPVRGDSCLALALFLGHRGKLGLAGFLRVVAINILNKYKNF